ncbi:MAG: ribulose-phosphate 3-epimerase [Candidatus Woesearchaeota archaeon]
MIKISASILPAMDNLENFLNAIDKSRIDMIHCDVMDGKFVENKVFTPDLVDKIREKTNKKIDMHLMVNNVDGELKKYLQKDIDFVTVHYEAFNGEKHELTKVISLLKLYGKKAGISIKPETSVESIENILRFVDLVLVMSVEPGKSGQSFIDSSIDKIKYLDTFRRKQKRKFMIEVDGGVNHKNVKKIKKAGADIVVMGTSLYNAYKDKTLKKSIKKIRKLK